MSSRDPDLTPVVPRWLSQFVREKLRPALVQHYRVAHEALARWLVHHAQQIRERNSWEAARQACLEQLPILTEVDDPRPPRPDRDVGWLEGCPQRGVHVGGWGPPELASDREPPVDNPLPPPSNRDLTSEECWAALTAVHDFTRDRRERVSPTDDIAYEVLTQSAAELTESHLPELSEMLNAVVSEAESRVRTPSPAPDASRPARKPRSRGNPGLDEWEKQAMVKAYSDYKASELKRKEYLRERGFFSGMDEAESLAYLERCRKHWEKANRGK